MAEKDLGSDAPCESGVRRVSVAGRRAVIEAAAVCNHGGDRALSVDTYLMLPTIPFLAVVSGIGADPHAERAARKVVETMCAAMLDGLSAPESLVPALDLCARLLQQRARATVTLAGVIFAEEAARVVHIGHARCYRLRGGALARLTVDHTFGAQCVREHLMTPEQAARSPHRHMLTRALGAADAEVESATFGVVAGDLFLLATHGLHGFLSDTAIEAILRADDDPERAAVRLALAAGSSLDVTAVVAKAR